MSSVRPCDNCGRNAYERQMEAVDVSREDEYYPTFHYICPGCQRRFGDE